MRLEVQATIDLLRRTPAVLRTLLAGLGPQWTHSNYGEDTFSPFDVLGHLIHGEKTDWMARARIILERGTARPFDRYDRYAQFEASRGRTLDELLDEFERLRTDNLKALADLGLTERQLALRGVHPSLGEVTLTNLLATWVAHDLNHLAQIARCLATQYADAVGPWREYLTILKLPVTRMDPEGAARRRAASEAKPRPTAAARNER